MSYEVYGPYIPVVMLITFIGLFIWVLLPGNRKSFDEASNLPFADEEKAEKAEKTDNGESGTNSGRNEQ